MQVNELLMHLREIEKIPSEQWMKTLNKRKIEELEFHDRDRNRETTAQLDQDSYDKYYGNRKYYKATDKSRKYAQTWIAKNCSDKVFLDYACGNGSNAITAAKAGAKLAIGFDISPVSVQNAKDDAEKNGVTNNTFFLQADAENTKLPSHSIDLIICSGMLHHLDLSYAFPEMRRILAPGGKILCIEALAYNPAIQIYRWLTPSMRTNYEKNHILGFKDLEFANRFFLLGEIKFWHIVSILAPHMPRLHGVLQSIDDILTHLPLIRRLAWIFTFELLDRKDN